MKLIMIAESDPLDAQLIKAIGTKPFKKWQDPNRPENTGRGEGAHGTAIMPDRSGNQDTPLTPRLRKYMNAPTGATQGKIGYGPVDDAASRRPHLAQVDGEETNDPQDPNDLDHTSVQKRARSVFGKDALNAQLPRPSGSQKPPS